MGKKSSDDNRHNNTDFELLYVLGMLFVICGHYNVRLLTLGEFFSYDTFHVPLFFFSSGYFYKRKYSSNIDNYLEFAKKKILHLILPYVAWNVVYYIIAFIIQYNTEFSICSPEKMNIRSFIITPFKYADGAVYNIAGWFCITLFFVQILYNTICICLKKVKNNYLQFTILNLCIAAITICSVAFVDKLPVSLSRTGYLLFFYNFGFIFHAYIEKYIVKVKPVIVLIICVLLNAYFLITCGHIEPICFSMERISVKFLSVYISKAIVGSVFWLMVCRIIPERIKSTKTVSYFAKHTFSLMMHQGIAGIIFNGIIIKLFNREELLDKYHTRIWFNAFHNKWILPILICISILLACKLYDLIKMIICEKASDKKAGIGVHRH